MSTTPKYDADRFDQSVTGFDGLADSNVQLWDDVIQTYLRYQVAPGEQIAPYDPTLIKNGGAFQSWETDGRWPANGISVEESVKTSGEWVRIRRAGEITNPTWDLSGSGEVWIGPGSGEVTQNRPADYSWEKSLGSSSSPTAIIVKL